MIFWGQKLRDSWIYTTWPFCTSRGWLLTTTWLNFFKIGKNKWKNLTGQWVPFFSFITVSFLKSTAALLSVRLRTFQNVLEDEFAHRRSVAPPDSGWKRAETWKPGGKGDTILQTISFYLMPVVFCLYIFNLEGYHTCSRIAISFSFGQFNYRAFFCSDHNVIGCKHAFKAS